MLGRGMVADPGLALAVRAALGVQAASPVAWSSLLPLMVDFWRLVSGRVERRHRAGRLKQWLNYLRRVYPEAQEAFMALRTINDPVLIEQWLKTQVATAPTRAECWPDPQPA
jgi:tRNA-dihydrouridine synthase C